MSPLVVAFAAGLGGALIGAAVAVWWMTRYARIDLTVSAFDCNASAIADWLGAHGMVAMPMGQDIKPDAQLTQRVR